MFWRTQIYRAYSIFQHFVFAQPVPPLAGKPIAVEYSYGGTTPYKPYSWRLQSYYSHFNLVKAYLPNILVVFTFLYLFRFFLQKK